MWIRSQDRMKLVNGNTFEVFDKSVVHGGNILGEYKSEERALEVLDEIQVAVLGVNLIPEPMFTGTATATVGEFDVDPFAYVPIQSLPKVYEMPKE